MNTIPYLFQHKGVLKIEKNDGRMVVADEQGTGKSFQVCYYMDRNVEETTPTVIVCPASLKLHWQREAYIHNGITDCIVLEKMKKIKSIMRTLPRDPRMVIINYEILGPWLPYLHSVRPRLVVIDESQRIKNPETAAYRNVDALCKDVPHVLPLTGTPISNSPVELWPSLNLVRPDRFPSRLEFCWEYGTPERKPWGWEFKGANKEKLPELHEILHDEGLLLRRLKSEVMSQLPKKIRTIVPVRIKRQEYDDAREDFLSWVRKSAPTAKVRRVKRAEGLAKIGYIKRLIADLKIEAIIEWTRNFLDSGEKLLLFGIHHFFLDAIHDAFPKISVQIDGRVASQKRQPLYDAINDNDRIRLGVLQITAAGVGWSCRSTSSTAHGELDWVPASHIQASDRTHGVGRGLGEQPSWSYFIVAHDTMEVKWLKLLDYKQQVASTVLDGGDNEDFDMFEQLIQGIMEEGK